MSAGWGRYQTRGQLQRVQLAKGADGCQNWARFGPFWGLPVKKRRADFWAALGDNGNNGIEELLKLYWWWGSDTADFFFDKFVPAGLSLENLEAEKKNAIGTMLTAVREDISQLPRTVKAQRRDMDRLAVSVADAAFDARLAERRHYVVLARPL